MNQMQHFNMYHLVSEINFLIPFIRLLRFTLLHLNPISQTVHFMVCTKSLATISHMPAHHCCHNSHCHLSFTPSFKI